MTSSRSEASFNDCVLRRVLLFASVELGTKYTRESVVRDAIVNSTFPLPSLLPSFSAHHHVRKSRNDTTGSTPKWDPQTTEGQSECLFRTRVQTEFRFDRRKTSYLISILFSRIKPPIKISRNSATHTTKARLFNPTSRGRQNQSHKKKS